MVFLTCPRAREFPYQSSILTIPFSDSTVLWLNMSSWRGLTIVICLHDTARVRIWFKWATLIIQDVIKSEKTTGYTLSATQVHWNAYLFSKHEERRRKNLFPVRTVYRRLVDQRSFAFCCQHLPFLSVDTDIGVHTKTKQSYNLKRNNHWHDFRRKLVFFASLGLFGWRHAKPQIGVTQVSWDGHEDSRERELFLKLLLIHQFRYIKIQPNQ